MAIDSNEFRRLMGSFAAGVTVVTTEVDGLCHGITVSGFSSLSLEPMLLLICISKTARAHAELTRAGHFAVNVLGESGIEASNAFAKSGEPEAGTMRGIPFRRGETGAPLLDDAVATVECRVHATHDGGDHTIFVGEVVAGQCSEGEPLVYYRSSYRALAPKED